MLQDCIYEVTLGQNAAALPPVIPNFVSKREDSSGSISPRTPRITPRTPPSSPKHSTEDESTRKSRRKDFFVYDLLMQINFDNIVEMKSAFIPAGVTMVEFVKVMKKAVSHSKEEESKIISQLCELFAEIDIDGDQIMSWEEFTSFMMKSGLGPYDPQRAMKKYVEEPLFSVNRFKYISKLDRLIVCDGNRDKVVKVYKPESINRQNEWLLHKELKGHSGSILDADYLEWMGNKYLVTSSTDANLFFWDIEANYRLRSNLSLEVIHPQLSVLWSASHETLFSTDTQGIIHGYGVEKNSGKFAEKQRFQGHSDLATSMVLIPNTPLLATGSTDSTILTWDVNLGTKQRELRGHVKGVFSLAYSHEHRFLLSAGSDRDALVWNPMVKSKPIFRLKGHHTSLVAVEVLEGTPQLLTADLDGIFKLWDIRTFECVQTFTGSESKQFKQGSEISAFSTAGPHNQIICGGSKMTVFEYNKPGTPWLTMDSKVELAIFNGSSSTILTAGGDSIKIWDAKNGRLLRIFTGLCNTINNEAISAICLDSGKRKIFVGDTEGNITVLNYSNGAVLKKLDSHKSLVSKLIYCEETKCIISASWDNIINIHDELDSYKKGRTILRSMSGHKKDVTAAAFSESLSLVASGTSDGIVWVWDFQKCGFEAKLEHNILSETLKDSTKWEITSIVFMSPYPVICSADMRGQIILWTVKPAPNKYQRILRLENTPDYYGRPEGVHSMVWNHHDEYLIVGDVSGTISIWNFSSFLEENIVEPVKPTKTQGIKKKFLRYRGENFPRRISLPPMPLPQVPIVARWKGHYGTITSLEYIQNPKSILSASVDKRVRIWGISGEYYGTLRQAPQGGRWRFPLDETEKRLKEAKKVKEIQVILEKSGSKKKVTEEESAQTVDYAALEKQWNDNLRSREKEKKSKISKFGPNMFYESMRSRMKTGNPEIKEDRFPF